MFEAGFSRFRASTGPLIVRSATSPQPPLR